MELNELQKENNKLKLENLALKKKIAELEANTINNSSGGRPEKFTKQEKETMKMYRLQGKSIRKIAELFECSVGLVHKIVNEE